MSRSTDITGTFRVPEESWGRFWNAMASIDGAEITPEIRVRNPNSKPGVPGMSARMIILGVLENNPRKKLTGDHLADLIDEAGKNRDDVPKLLRQMQTQKLIKGDAKGYLITPAGLEYYQIHYPKQRSRARHANRT